MVSTPAGFSDDVPRPLESVLRRDRLIAMSGLAGIGSLAWLYLLRIVQSMENMTTEMAQPNMQSWMKVDVVLTFAMWTVMMVAMMLPSASPMIILFATAKRKRREQHDPHAPTFLFLLSYLVVWVGFAALATLAQWGLHNAALLSVTIRATSPILAGGLLTSAGIFQWTKLKRACLNHCRSPLGFLMTYWREGKRGAFLMGLRHGSYCVGCCWALMLLLFVAGVMNLLWVGIIAVFILIEKVAPAGFLVGRVAGLLLIGMGALIISGSLS